MLKNVLAITCSTLILVSCGENNNKNSAAPKLNENGLEFITIILANEIRVALLDGKSTIQKVDALKIISIDGMVQSIKLAKDYDSNEVSADEKYKNKTFIVSGKVLSINKDFTGMPFVKLNGINMFQSVHAQFAERHSNSSTLYGVAVKGESIHAQLNKRSNLPFISELKKGQNVNFVCKIDNYIVRDVVIRDCKNVDSYVTENMGKVKTLMSDFLSLGKSISKKFDVLAPMFYVAGQAFPSENACKTDPFSEECTSDISKIIKSIPKETFEKVKAELESQKKTQ